MIPEEEGAPSLEAARQLILAHRPELAEPELRRLLAAYPDSAHGHALLGWCLALLERADEAIASSREAVRLAPDWPFIHISMAEVYLQLGRNRDAERSARTALELGVFDPAYHAILAAALLNQGLRRVGPEALRQAELGLALNPEHAGCARLRALALSRLRRHEEAREAAAYALRLAPNESPAHATAGWVELAAGNRVRSRELLRGALRMDPVNDHALHGLRLAAYHGRMSASMLVQAERWAKSLSMVGAVFAVEMAAALTWGEGGFLVLGVACSLWILATVGGSMLWVQLCHPRTVAELRMAGPDGIDAREARQMLIMYVVLLLISPVAALLP
jgi:tetratricopeptide (TPR) repeat protein